MIGRGVLSGEQLGGTVSRAALDPAGLLDKRRDLAPEIRHEELSAEDRFIDLLEIGQRECFRQKPECGIGLFETAAQLQQ